jgi:magnesium transporter
MMKAEAGVWTAPVVHNLLCRESKSLAGMRGAEPRGRAGVGATVVVRWMVADEMKTGALDALDEARSSGGTVWVDVLEPDMGVLDVLKKAYDLHPLAIEDCIHFPQRPKLDTYTNNLFLVWIAPMLDARKALTTDEIDTFLGATYLITVRKGPVAALETVAADACGVLNHGAEWTLHAILDRSVDAMFPVVDMVGEELDRIENELLNKVEDGQLQELYAVKRVMLNLHKVIGPERDVLRAMARHDEFVSQEAYLYLQDVGDHVARVADGIDTYRDVAASAMDIYLSAISNRLNVVMKQLTVVATIFMPLTLITGIYGMNLTKAMWPSPEWSWSFPLVMVACVVIVIGMLYLLKWRRWW